MIAPGHTGPETGTAAEGTLTAILGTLRKQLGAFDMDREVSLVFAVGDLPPQSKDFERVIAVDLDRESADDETAIELELGPNNCAAGLGSATQIAARFGRATPPAWNARAHSLRATSAPRS